MGAKHILGWGLAVLGVVGAGPLVLGRSRPAYHASLQTISQMSEVERTALARRYEQYKAMPEEERAKLRQLHQELEADRARGARLIGTMHDYCDWLKLIDAWQQDELLHISDPLERARRVSEIHTERLQRSDSSPEDAPNEPQIDRFVFKEEHLNKMFDALLAGRVSNLTDEQKKEFDSAKGLKRWGLQMKLLNSVVPVDRLFQTMSSAEMKAMLEASEVVKLMDPNGFIAKAPEFRRKEMLWRTIARSIVLQHRRESTSLTDEQLQQYFATLPKERQDQLLKMRAEDFKNQLRFQSMEQDPDILILHKLMGPLLRNAQQMFDRPPAAFRGQGGPGGNGGGPFRPEEGGLDGERRPLNRAFDGRRPDGRPFREGPPDREGFGPPGPPPGEGSPNEGREERRGPGERPQ